MANLISFDDGTHLDLDTDIGAYRYVSRYLTDTGAPSSVFSALEKLHSSNSASISRNTIELLRDAADELRAQNEWKANSTPRNRSELAHLQDLVNIVNEYLKQTINE